MREKYLFWLCIILFSCNSKDVIPNEIEYEYRGEEYYTDLDSINIDDFYETSYYPPEGCIPNAKVAVEVAEPILKHVYGKYVIEKEKPFIVYLLNNKVWSICGTLSDAQAGGAFFILIKKKDGKVLSIGHEK